MESVNKGVVVRIKGSGTTRRRIMDMGIVGRSEIKVIRQAPLKNRMEFEIRDYNLLLRKKKEITYMFIWRESDGNITLPAP
ncbi:MAG: FeoA domain-containing protein [Candidatus Methylarchaceae archaeon HK01M]|nr:FeoA domain-containing protein [Candidatus Methylarchaceae archaeon HK01M]